MVNRPRLSGRRHSPRAGHRLAMLAGARISLRRSLLHASQAVGLLCRHHKNTCSKAGIFVVTPRRIELRLKA